MGGRPANDIAAYCYYFRRRVAVSGVLPQIGNAERLDDLAVVNASAEHRRDCRAVRPETVR